jgi:hypothetical protein
MGREHIFDYIFCNSGVYHHQVITLEEIECGGLRISSTDVLVARRIFTGVYGRNMVPIYLGDIISSGLGEIVWTRGKFQVKWHGTIYRRVRGEKPEDLFGNSDIVWDVIGNIYENPNLLEQI